MWRRLNVVRRSNYIEARRWPAINDASPNARPLPVPGRCGIVAWPGRLPARPALTPKKPITEQRGRTGSRAWSRTVLAIARMARYAQCWCAITVISEIDLRGLNAIGRLCPDPVLHKAGNNAANWINKL